MVSYKYLKQYDKAESYLNELEPYANQEINKEYYFTFLISKYWLYWLIGKREEVYEKLNEMKDPMIIGSFVCYMVDFYSDFIRTIPGYADADENLILRFMYIRMIRLFFIRQKREITESYCQTQSLMFTNMIQTVQILRKHQMDMSMLINMLPIKPAR